MISRSIPRLVLRSLLKTLFRTLLACIFFAGVAAGCNPDPTVPYVVRRTPGPATRAQPERHRWLPEDLGSDYVFVNLTDYRLTAYRDGRPALDMPVVVGKDG